MAMAVPAAVRFVGILVMFLMLESVVSYKVDFRYSTSSKLVVEDVVNSGQKMAEEALIPVK